MAVLDDIMQSEINRTNSESLSESISIVSFNLHGLNQGRQVVRELIDTVFPDIVLLQEHWLTPSMLYKLTDDFPEYIAIGKSAMELCVQQGPLRGRPFGGVSTLVKRDLFEYVHILHCSDRYVVIRFLDFTILNVYMPCKGTELRLFVIENILQEMSEYVVSLHGETIIIGGDINVDLNSTEQASVFINSFLTDNKLNRCDALYPSSIDNNYTHFKDTLGHYSIIDYFITSDLSKLKGYNIIDPSVNLSDHRPIIANFLVKKPVANHTKKMSKAQDKKVVAQLRWDHSDLLSYYNLTGVHVQNLLQNFDCQVKTDCCKSDLINYAYDKLISILQYCASKSVPLHYKGFYKFWWDQELDLLKEESIKSHTAWKLAGRPRSGPCFNKYKSDKLAYKLRIRNNQEGEKLSYTNDLNDALILKQGNTFWNCWRSKFSSKGKRPLQIDNLTRDSDIADHFAYHFKNICTIRTVDGNKKLQDIYLEKRSAYNGTPFTSDLAFNAELIEDIINKMKRGKAAGLDGLTAEHLQHSHPSLPTFLAKLFNLIIDTGIVPEKFGLSYTIPLLKGNTGSMGKSLAVSDFRGISISPAISKIFENCILQKYKKFFATSDNQFGFKKLSGCSNAIYTVRQTVENFTKNGTTVNMCALDLSKAFDKVNHFGLFSKLMDRAVPIMLLKVLEHWFRIHTTCVRFGTAVSSFVSLECGVRQGGVLSPHLFNIYIDGIIKQVSNSKYCCNLRFACVSIFMYADDIILMSPSVTILQKLFQIVEDNLKSLEMSINPSKSSCIRFGPRYDCVCANIITDNGSTIEWAKSCQYLGVTMLSSRLFKCVFDNSKKSFYKSFNAIFGKIGRFATADVVMHLLKTKCLPILLYGLNACPVNATDKKSLEFVIFRTLAKIFGTFSSDIINECRIAFNFPLMVDNINKQKTNFLLRYCMTENILCKIFARDAEREINSLRMN
jgi:exonuclease III